MDYVIKRLGTSPRHVYQSTLRCYARMLYDIRMILITNALVFLTAATMAY